MGRTRLILADLLLIIGIALWFYVFNGSKGPHMLLIVFLVLLSIPAVYGCIKMHKDYYKMTKRIF
jgi:hypothetical protein